MHSCIFQGQVDKISFQLENIAHRKENDGVYHRREKNHWTFAVCDREAEARLSSAAEQSEDFGES